MLNPIGKTHLEKIAQAQSHSADRVATARASVGKVSQNLVLLEQNTRVGRQRELSEEDRQAYLAVGAWTKQDADGLFSIYAKTVAPYLSVEGRLQLFLDDLEEEGETFSMEQSIDWEHRLFSVTLHSRRGTVVGSARIAEGGSGVDATNPLENAQTSALGRALGFLGYGLFTDPPAPPSEAPAAKEALERSDGDASPPPSAVAITTEIGTKDGSEPSSQERRSFYLFAQQAGFSVIDELGRPSVDFQALGHFLKERGLSSGSVKNLDRAELQQAWALLGARLAEQQSISA